MFTISFQSFKILIPKIWNFINNVSTIFTLFPPFTNSSSNPTTSVILSATFWDPKISLLNLSTFVGSMPKRSTISWIAKALPISNHPRALTSLTCPITIPKAVCNITCPPETMPPIRGVGLSLHALWSVGAWSAVGIGNTVLSLIQLWCFWLPFLNKALELHWKHVERSLIEYFLATLFQTNSWQLTVRPRQAPWIMKAIKHKRIEHINPSSEMVSHIRDLMGSNVWFLEDAKHNYFTKIGQTLSNADTGQKPIGL